MPLLLRTPFRRSGYPPNLRFRKKYISHGRHTLFRLHAASPVLLPADQKLSPHLYCRSAHNLNIFLPDQTFAVRKEKVLPPDQCPVHTDYKEDNCLPPAYSPYPPPFLPIGSPPPAPDRSVLQHHNCGTCRQKQDQNKNSKFTAVFRFCIQRPTPPSNILDFSGRSRSSPEYFLHAP